MTEAQTSDMVIFVDRREECRVLLGNRPPRGKPKSEPRPSILSSFQHYNQISNKIEASHVWGTVAYWTDPYLCIPPVGPVQQRRWIDWQQQKLCWHVNFVFFAVIAQFLFVERSRPDGFNSLYCRFTCFFSSRLCSWILLGSTLSLCQWNSHLVRCHPPTTIICR